MSHINQRGGANAVGASFVLWGLIIAMLIFTSIRTVHLLQLTFSSQDKYVAYLGLAAFDVGVLGWFYYATAKARGSAQRAVAYGMIFVCALGVTLATIADFFYQADANGITKLPAQIITIALWGVILVVVLNFLAGILTHLVDPKHLQSMKEEQLHDTIISASHSHMEQMTNQIAPEIAAVLASEWRERITAELIGKLPQNDNKKLTPFADVNKMGRKKNRNAFVDEVVMFEDKNILPNWARLDQYKTYIKTQAAVTPNERFDARKRLGI